jgi:hypothetical protein
MLNAIQAMDGENSRDSHTIEAAVDGKARWRKSPFRTPGREWGNIRDKIFEPFFPRRKKESAGPAHRAAHVKSTAGRSGGRAGWGGDDLSVIPPAEVKIGCRCQLPASARTVLDNSVIFLLAFMSNEQPNNEPSNQQRETKKRPVTRNHGSHLVVDDD